MRVESAKPPLQRGWPSEARCPWSRDGRGSGRCVLASFFALILLLQNLLSLLAAISMEDMCGVDSGPATIVDADGLYHNVYISVTRDGSVWLRMGLDHTSLDWIYVDEPRTRFHAVILDSDDMHVLQAVNYTSYCVLTDADLRISVESGWHPSHLDVFDPRSRQSRIVLFRHNRDCSLSTNLALTADKQGLLCNGGRRNACGRRHLPHAGRPSRTAFIKAVNLDPLGSGRWHCDADVPVSQRSSTSHVEFDARNRYTFVGSYYHAYVKLASCPPPTASRSWGHEAKLRPHTDNEQGLFLIVDPSQTAISDGVVSAWRVFAKVVSVQHAVYFQVWRPVVLPRRDKVDRHRLRHRASAGATRTTTHGGPSGAREYTLIGQTFFHPADLRVHELRLDVDQRIAFRRGDVLGLHFASFSPVTWSAVPCADVAQRYLVARRSNFSTPLRPGERLRFQLAAVSEDQRCRQYSFNAALDGKSRAKSIEDWRCPPGRRHASRGHPGAMTTEKHSSSSSSSVHRDGSTTAQLAPRSPGYVPPAAAAIAVDAADGDRQRSTTLFAFPYVVGTVACVGLLLVLVGVVSFAVAARS